MRKMHPLLDMKFGEMWLDFFVTKEGRHNFGTVYAWLISRMEPLAFHNDQRGVMAMLRKNRPLEFQNSLTTSLDAPDPPRDDCKGKWSTL